MKALRIWLLCGLLAGVVCSCAPAPDKQQRVLTLALNWLPEAEHGGFYAALLNGYFEEEGLNVEIQPGGPDSPVIQQVGVKRVAFGIANADRVALGQHQGAQVVAVLAPLQHSPRCIMVHEESGIKSLQDLKNVTLSMSDAPAFAYYLKHHLPLEGVLIVRSSGSLSQFLRDPKFAQQAYVFSEPIVALREGVKTRSLMVSELGFDPYTSLLVTHADLLKEQPELVRKFVNASRKGWQSYLSNPGPVHAYLNKINPEMPVEVLDGGLEQLKKLCLEDDDQFTGNMQPERWQTLVEQMEEVQLLEPGKVNPEKLYSLEFLK